MKLALSRNLDGPRAEALSRIDQEFAQRAHDALAPIHDVKFAMAQRYDPALEPEARERGLSVVDLCRLILERRQQSERAVIEIDRSRAAIKAQIVASNDEFEIRRIVAGEVSGSQRASTGL